MRVLVCGGRGFGNDTLLFGTLNSHHKRRPITALIHGGASGADRMAALWAVDKGIPHTRFLPDWKRHGKAAGPIRNARMIAEGKPDLVIAFPGGRGTANMIAQAKQAGIEVVIVIE